jgi:predicted unusual protein kinase regulating ubiquinone biosynthesis (AarF/ABC1/UbiB family)
VSETKKNLPKELDFLHEAANTERARQMLADLPFLKVFPFC